MEQATEQPAAPGAENTAAAEPPPAAEQHEQERGEQDVQQDAALYTLPGLEGQWTLAQLVEMELGKDPRFAQVRRSALPPAFWDVRRRARNRERTLRNYERRKRKGEALREAEAARKAALTPAQAAAHEAEQEAAREAAKAAAAAQRAAVAEAMSSGLRVVVDCSLSAGGAASDREVRSLCKQLMECAAANKRARRPVSLQFAGFTGPVRAFAVEGMHADRWPAAAGHEAPLAQLFPPEQLVVLSPDAEEPLGELQADKVYVIGGLVDRTVAKGASLGLAQRCGAAAVRLPIAEHLGAGAMAGGKGVLNVNDVFAALLAVHAGDGWRAALEAAIPQRFRQQAAGGQGSTGQRRQQQQQGQQRQQQGQQQQGQQQQRQQQEEVGGKEQQQEQEQKEQEQVGGEGLAAAAVAEGGQAAACEPEGGSEQLPTGQRPAAAIRQQN